MPRERAAALAQSIDDSSLRARRLADVDVAIGAAIAASDPAGAIAPLTRAIDFYRREDLPIALPEPLLLRARCALRTGDAQRRRPRPRRRHADRRAASARAAAAAGTGILDADHALFAEAIRLHLDRGDERAAFAVAERARGATMTVAELQQRLAGSATAVLEIALLPNELAIFAVTEDDLRVARRRAELATLARLADSALSETGTTAAAALYDDLLRPVDPVLSRVRSVILVPDPRLDRVPVAALFDRERGTYLVERVNVAIASSAASLQRDDARPGTVARHDDASHRRRDRNLGVGAGSAEAAEIGALYPRRESDSLRRGDVVRAARSAVRRRRRACCRSHGAATRRWRTRIAAHRRERRWSRARVVEDDRRDSPCLALTFSCSPHVKRSVHPLPTKRAL